MRRVVNALLYVLVSGVQWRLLPREFPRWDLVYYYFRRWSRLGVWKHIYHVLRALWRQRNGRHKHPTAGCLDSQSVKSSLVAGERASRGWDNAKKVQGRKRHLLVDTLGLALEVVVTPANVSESKGASLVWKRLGRRRGVTKKLRKVWVDGGYKEGVLRWCEQKQGVVVQVVEREPGQKGFVLQKRRWVVERSFSRLSATRRLARDYEGKIQSSETMIWIAFTRILLRRLA